MDEPSTLTGPDLEKGIATGDLADGGMLEGHARGEQVLVARRGKRLFAIGARCTHYGGPLADGILVGDTVRCPWHHACFSLASGEALRAPALNPVECWRIEERGAMIYVGEKTMAAARRPDPVTPGSPARPAKIVIVCAGAAGNAAAETLRHEGYSGSITMIGAEPSLPCDRPNLSKDFLAGTAPEAWLSLRAPEFYADKGISLVTGSRVTAIDVGGRSVVMQDGSMHSYDALLLATGAEPLRPRIPGRDLPHVHTLRTVADSRAIIAAAEKATRVVVMGASFIGLEAAASLRARDIEVHVVAPEAVPLEKIMGREVGEFVRRIHEKHGVVFHLGQAATAIDPRAVTLADGTRLPADLVILGVGVRPSVSLAEAAGIAIDNGVLVDAYLATSVPGIYAAGDVARFPDSHTGERLRIEHWVMAERQGRTAGLNLLGRGERFRAVPFFWSAHHDVTVCYVGHAGSWDRTDISGSLDALDARIDYYRGDTLLAVATVGRDRESLSAELKMEHDHD